uniref:HTH CENPB-type domain-containing protein n=1 Tax=Latimeria chalumnae TaxID=7897 RepID=H3AXG2_LATCH
SSYDAGSKLQVVEYAEQSSNLAAGHEFSIMEKTVRWRRIKETLKERPKTKRARHGNMQPFAALEVDLNEWVLQSRQNGYIMTRNAVRLRALKMAKEDVQDRCKQYLSCKPFVASVGWCTFFFWRYLGMNQEATEPPKDLEMKVNSFLKFAIKLWKEHDYYLSRIGNMVETPVTFDLPSNQSVSPLGLKTVLVKTTGHEKPHFMITLTYLADGSKLKPLVIFKRKTLPENKVFPSGVLVRVHLKGWIDEEGTWLKKVWSTRPGALCKRSILVWDMFRAHETDSVKKATKYVQTDSCIFPGGLTTLLQPQDVCLNELFKDRLREIWTEWMCSGSAALTKGGNLKKPDTSLICKWVKDTWESVPDKMNHCSFLKCGINNTMDGSQDAAIYEISE